MSPGIVITRRSLIVAGSIVVAVSMTMSAVVAVAVTAWITSRGVLQEAAETQVAVQPAHSQCNLQVTSVSNSTALTASPMQSAQVFTSAPLASVAPASTGLVKAGQNAAPDSNITLIISPSRPTIRLGESFTLTVEVKGADRGLNTPDLSALPQADVLFFGQRSNSRSSVSIINGYMTRGSFEGRVFSYKITPKSHGTYHTGPVRVTAAGKTYTHPGVTVEVAEVPGP